MNDQEALQLSRALRDAMEPFVGSVYFSPECHAEYAALGFSPSAAQADGVALPDGPAYFTSRGSVMGQVNGHVVAAAFGVFSPAAVVPAVTYGWTLTDAATICAARDRGAIAQLTRILGDEPAGVAEVRDALRSAVDASPQAGRPLFSGLLAQSEPETLVGQAWRAGDRLRELRGDAHNAAWTSAGLDAVEIGLLTEGYLGLPFVSYLRTRAWTEQQMADAMERLRSRGLVDAGGLTTHGRDLREGVEATTDLQLQPAVKAMGERADAVIGTLGRWSTAVRSAKGYLTGGAKDLSNRGAQQPR